MNLILFFVSSGILFWVLRYRVHIHITYQGQPQKTRRSPAAALRRAAPRVCGGAAGASTQADISSALINLGCPRTKAFDIAMKVFDQSPSADFTVLLKQAIREAA